MAVMPKYYKIHTDGHAVELELIYIDLVPAVREKGEWILHMDGSSTCKKCRTNTKYSWDFDNSFNFCPHCGADMRKGENDGEVH